MTQEQENFYRHSTVIVDETKDSFLQLLEFHLTNQGITLQQFIEINGHFIYHMCFNRYPCCQCPSGTRAETRGNRVLHPPQMEILFDKTGIKLPAHNPGSLSAPNCCCPVNPNLQLHDLDFTLARLLLVNFTTLVPQGSPERNALDSLVNSRNQSFAHAKEGRISNSEYQNSMADIEKSILVLAKVYGKEADTKQRLKDIAKQPLNFALCLQLQNTLLQQCQIGEKLNRLLAETLPEYLTKDLEDIRVVEGCDAKLELWTRDTDVNVEWFKGDIKIEVSDKYVVNSSGQMHSLIVTNADLTDRGMYGANIMDSKRTAKINVQEYFTKNMAETSACKEGDDVHLSCAVRESNIPAYWAKNGISIKPSTKYKPQVMGKTHMLSIIQLDLQDAGYYSVTINNRTRTSLIQVKEYFTQNMQGIVECVDGENVEFICAVIEDSVPAVWAKDGVVVQQSAKYKIEAVGMIHKLSIIRADQQDSGMYTVMINNRTRSTSLKVNDGNFDNVVCWRIFKESQVTSPEEHLIEPCRQMYSASSTTNTITIKWKPVEIIAGFKATYEIKYKEANVKGKYKKEESEEAEIVLMDLKSKTNYEVIICYTNEQEETVRMFKAFNVETKQSSYHSLFLANSDCDNTTTPAVYALKVANCSTYYVDVKIKNETHKIPLRACEMISNYHPERHRGRPEKSILLLGETGSGKSTLLDAVINYIGEVSFDDNYRLSLINRTEEERKRAQHQYQSQTLGITCYRIPHLEGMPLNFPLNLIDTPGFADTRGKEFDDPFTDQIEVLFRNVIQQIDAICIIVPLSCVRLNKCTEDTYDRILKLFGKDIKDNIFVLITKDDGGAPICLEAVRQAKVPFTKFFRFSNADLFVKSTSEEAINERQRFINRNKTFKRLFDAIDEVEPKSVEKSEKIVKARRQLNEQLRNMMAQLNDQLTIASVIKENKQYMETNKEEMLRNKDYVYKQLDITPILQYTGYNSLLCHTCKKTCQTRCGYKIYPYLCEVMSWSAKCIICQCASTTHEVMRCEYILKITEAPYTLKATMAANDNLHKIEMIYKKKLNEKQEQLEKSFAALATMIGHVGNLLDEINKNALKVEFTSIVEWIDHLTLQVQEDSSHKNREEGIRILKKIRDKILQKQPIKDIAFE